jgi:phage tail-like protein
VLTVAVGRDFATVRTEDQWRRSAHEGTSLRLPEAEVQLSWHDDEAGDSKPGPPLGAGLAFDGNCRLYHSLPAADRVERVLWAAGDPLQPSAPAPAPMDLFEAVPPPVRGDFHPADPPPGAVREPRGLAVDQDDRLYVAETGRGRVLVFDLWTHRLLRQVPLGAGGAAGPRPVALANRGRTVYVVTAGPAGVLRLEARTGPVPVPLPATITRPSRLAIAPDGGLVILEDAGKVGARVVSLDDPSLAVRVDHATDVAFDGAGNLVVARGPGADFLRFRIAAAALDALPPLKARGYDGLGIVRTPDGRIGFWTARGPRNAVAARLRYTAVGRVTTFRLDSGAYQTAWGRLFLDACIPRDTEVHAYCVADDEPPDGPTLPRTPPENTVQATLARPDLSPPMPPRAFVPAAGAAGQALHRRETGREQPWARPGPGEEFATYEAPILAGPGRFLWVTLELRGNTRSSPRVRALRVEYPTHDYLRRLPKTFSRDERSASFLARYLALFEGTLGELGARAEERRALLDPRGAPAEVLPWLAGFLGLVLDERWPARTRRTMIAEAAWLFRFRGTLPGLKRFLEIYTETDVILLEEFRLRGLGGAVLGGAGELVSSSVLGAGFRVGGAVGEAAPTVAAGTLDDAFRAHAHRFAVIIPASLDAEGLAVVRHILDLHRPAHTLVEVCTVDAGLRVGVRCLVGITSLVGRGEGFAPVQVGGSVLGRGAIVGRPEVGLRVGGGALGGDSRIG